MPGVLFRYLAEDHEMLDRLLREQGTNSRQQLSIL
jgi:hypothetical protein